MRCFIMAVASVVAAVMVVGCSSVAAKTNILSESDLLSKSAGALGYPVSELQILEQRVNGADTYVALMARGGKYYSCVINGGNLLSLGMTNPAIFRSKK
jgi:outer membrane murein-binding lipoprotein Lpp